MKLPAEWLNTTEWTLIGPMGPSLPQALLGYPLIAVDGGSNFCDYSDIWVGDGDSSVGELKAEHIFKYPAKKSVSDLTLALNLFASTHTVTLHCWGFLGGRRDHELLNLGEACRFLESRPGSRVFFYDGASLNISIKCLSTGTWDLTYKGTFSLAGLKTIKLKLVGSCEYTLEQPTELLPLSTLGLSNKATGEFCLTNEGPIMVFFPETD